MNIENNNTITLTKDIKNLITTSQETAIRAVDTGRVVSRSIAPAMECIHQDELK